MGVGGLMSYMKRNFHSYEDYELHGGYLVIDGHNLAFELYSSSACNCVFGGDYDVYADAVGKFFDDLAMCEVVPLIVMDGGIGHSKMNISTKNMKKYIDTASTYVPGTEEPFAPLAMMVVFMNVLRQKGVRVARCLVGCNPATAGIAQFLNCPVLSKDSDFYIYEGMYIQTRTLEKSSRTSDGNGYMKRCKLFKTQNLSKAFPGLDSSVLPLVAVLLDNDYVQSEVFENFFDSLRLSARSPRLYNIIQRKIDTVLRWLQNRNLNDAVAAILNTLPRKHREKLLVIIETVINSYYLSLPVDILVPLGFTDKNANALKERRCAYKFQGDIDIRETRRLRRTIDPTAELIGFELGAEKDARNERFAKSWPAWFVQCFTAVDFPTYFYDMLCYGLFKVQIQIEDFRYPSASIVSFKIVEVIYGLLVAGRKNPPKLLYLMRENFELIEYEDGTPMQGTISTEFPPLAELRNTPMAIRKQIMDDTLKIVGMEKFFQDIPEKWKLYLAVVFYWMRQTKEPATSVAHLSAILFAMLLGVVDDKIGYQRSLKDLETNHGKILMKTEADRKDSKNVNSQIRENSIIAALEAVTKEDCFSAAPFFIWNYKMDCRYPDQFNVTIVHVFAQFQCCLRHAMDLNALLGCPYENPTIAKMYNGTMLYNLYTKFVNHTDNEAYISARLEKSPSLQNLIRLLITGVKMNLDNLTISDNAQRRED